MIAQIGLLKPTYGMNCMTFGYEMQKSAFFNKKSDALERPISSFCSIEHGHCCMIFVVIFYIVLQITMVFFKRM